MSTIGTDSVVLQPAVIHDRRRALLLANLASALERQRRGMDPAAARGYGRALPPLVCDSGSGIGPWTGMKATLLRACYGPPPADESRVCAMGAATHVLLLEDDAEPGEHALEASITIAAYRPCDAVYLSATREQAGGEMDAAAETGLAYAFVHERVIGSVAVILPIPLARRFLRRMGDPSAEREFLDTFRHGAETAEAGDARLWWFLTNMAGQCPVVTATSIFGHGAWDPGQSLVARDGMQGPRRCYRPAAGVRGQSPPLRGSVRLDRQRSAVEVDWSSGADLDSRTALDRPRRASKGAPEHVLAE